MGAGRRCPGCDGGGGGGGGGGGDGGAGSTDESVPRAPAHVEMGGVKGKGALSDIKTPRSLTILPILREINNLSHPSSPTSPARLASSSKWAQGSDGKWSRGPPARVPSFTGVAAWGTPVASAGEISEGSPVGSPRDSDKRSLLSGGGVRDCAASASASASAAFAPRSTVGRI